MATKTVTNVNSPTLDTTNKKFGSASMLVTVADGLSIANDTDFDMGSGDFTVEWFIYPTNNSTNGICGQALFSTDICYFISSYGFGAPGAYFGIGNSAGTGFDYATPSANAISINNWHHTAMVRSGTNVYGYIDGTRSTLLTGYSSALRVSSNPFLIGAQQGGANGVIGNIDEVRISKGIARYTAATITVPTAEFTTDANTVLLMHFNSSPFVDESVASAGVTVLPTPQLLTLGCG